MWCKGAQTIARHDNLVHTLVAMLRAVLGRGNVLVEQLGYLGNGQKRMDIVVEVAAGLALHSEYLAKGPILVDLAVSTPTAACYLAGAAMVRGDCAEKRARAKHHKYDEHVQYGHRFFALVWEAFGLWCDELHALFQEVVDFVKLKGEDEGDPHAASHFLAYWLPTIQTTLMRANAQAVMHRSRRDRVAAGKRVAAGPRALDDEGGPF